MTQIAMAEQSILCPYCGEQIAILVDCSITSQEYIEDCQVCCCPISIDAHIEEETVIVNVRTDNE